MLLVLLLLCVCRSNAVRVLCQIVDSQLLAQIERYLKQAVVDKSPVVAASVLISAVHLVSNVSGVGMMDMAASDVVAMARGPVPVTRSACCSRFPLCSRLVCTRDIGKASAV